MEATTTQADQTDSTSHTAAQAKGAVHDAAAQAQEKLHDAAGQAREQAAQAAGQARSRMRVQVDQRSTELGHRAGSTADDLRSVSEQLRSQGKDQPAKIADDVAGHVERAAGYLKDSDADRLLHDLEDFGRQRPWAVIAGGLTLGLVASRFLKTSSTDRYKARSSPGSMAPIRSRSTSGSTNPAHGAGVGGTGVAGSTPRPTSASPLDKVAHDASRYAASTGSASASRSSSPFGTGSAGYGGTASRATEPSPPIDPPTAFSGRPLGEEAPSIGDPPATPTNRNRENGVGSDGLS